MSKPQKTNISAMILAGGQSRRFDYQDKGLIPISVQANHAKASSESDTQAMAAKPMVQQVLESLAPQVNSIAINCNQNTLQYQSILKQYYAADIPFIDFSQMQDQQTEESSSQQTQQLFKNPVCFNDPQQNNDSSEHLRGPLTGIYPFLKYCPSEWVFICPCDIPALPSNIVQNLCNALSVSDAEVSYPVDNEGHYHLAILLKRSAGLMALEKLIKDIEQSTSSHAKPSARSIKNWLGRMKSEQLSIDTSESAFANINSAKDKSQFQAQLKHKS